MMKKLLFVCSMMLLGVSTVSAQDIERGIFNHLGANAALGTEGISLGLATTITPYLELSAGVNFFPSAKINGDVSIGSINTGIPGYSIPASKVKIEADLARTTFDLKLNAYPFGDRAAFFVAAGLSMGSKELAKMEGHSDEIRTAIATYPQLRNQIYAEIDKYNVKFDDNGDVKGDARVNAVRPYLGLGYGRLVPNKRVGFRFELGVQFHGDIKVYQDDTELDVNSALKGDDDLSKFIDKLTVYPVMKFVLTTRIF